MTRQEKRKEESKEWWRKNGAAYRAANRERLKAIAARWRANNREVANARSRKWREDHPDRQRKAEENYRTKNPEKRKASNAKYLGNPLSKKRQAKSRKVWSQANKPLLCAKAAKRRSAKLNATPPWADLSEIARVYDRAARMTEETGIPHHVDHIIPLQGKAVCGLHVHWNMQILTAVENLKKSNSLAT